MSVLVDVRNDDHCVFDYVGLSYLVAGGQMCCGIRTLAGASDVKMNAPGRLPPSSRPSTTSDQANGEHLAGDSLGSFEDTGPPFSEHVCQPQRPMGEPRLSRWMDMNAGAHGLRPSLADILQEHLQQDLSREDTQEPEIEPKPAVPTEDVLGELARVTDAVLFHGRTWQYGADDCAFDADVAGSEYMTERSHVSSSIAMRSANEKPVVQEPPNLPLDKVTCDEAVDVAVAIAEGCSTAAKQKLEPSATLVQEHSSSHAHCLARTKQTDNVAKEAVICPPPSRAMLATPATGSKPQRGSTLLWAAWAKATDKWRRMASRAASLRHSNKADEASKDNELRLSREDFAIGDTIGHGSYGRVFTARHSKTGKIVAVKELVLNDVGSSNTSELERFHREVTLCEQLKHPRIVCYLGHEFIVPNADNFPGRLLLFLEYCSGGSVALHLRTYGPMESELVAKYARQLLEGLCYLHSRSPPVVHRDLKCANLLFTHDAELKIADFGSSKWVKEGLSAGPHTLTGTILWMAPELLIGRTAGSGGCTLTTASDIWSLGCCVLEMLTARLPWDERHFDNIFEACRVIVQPDALPEFPEHLPPLETSFLDACFHRTPAARPTAEELLLHAFLLVTGRKLA